MVRSITKRDIDKIGIIHSKFYNDEFPLSDLNRFMTSFVVTDDNDDVICAGGIRTIVEAIIVTDKDVEVNKRREALLKMLEVAKKTTKTAGYDQIHAFVQDYHWLQHLIDHGFRQTVGESLVIDVEK